MEQHRASTQAYKKVHKETMRSELRMAIVQQSMEMDIWEIKQLLAERSGYKSDQKHNVKKIPTKTMTEDSCEGDDNMIELCRHTNQESNITEPHITIVTKTIHKEKSGESYTSRKEVKGNRFKGAHVTYSEVADECGGKNMPQTDSTLKDLDSKDIGTCTRVLESANNQDNMSMTWAVDQSRVPNKDVPSHGQRKQQMGGQSFGAELGLTVGFDLRDFEGLDCDLGRGQERKTWNPGINHNRSERK